MIACLVQPGDGRERLEQVVGVDDAVAGVIAVHCVARRRPRVPVIDEVLAQLRLVDPHHVAVAPEAVGVHDQRAVPLRRDLDPVGGAVAGDARPHPGLLAAGTGDRSERAGVGRPAELARRVRDLDTGDDGARRGDAAAGAERRPGGPGRS